MRSIIQKERKCYVCETTENIEEHHICYGTANRKLSEKYGLKVYLCYEHHRGKEGVHKGNRRLDLHLKQIAQRKFEKKYIKEDFIQIFRRNYL